MLNNAGPSERLRRSSECADWPGFLRFDPTVRNRTFRPLTWDGSHACPIVMSLSGDACPARHGAGLPASRTTRHPARPTMAEEHTVESSLKTPGRTHRVGTLIILSSVPLAALGAGPDGTDEEKAKATAKPADVKAAKVSYDKQVRPIFQAHCQGCHQPAKAGGAYVMTAFDRMLKGGESETPAIVPGKPGESHLIELITPRGRQGRDAPGQAAAGRLRGRADQPVDRPGGRRRHAAEPGQAVRHGASARVHPAAGDPGPGLLARRLAPGRRRVPRGLALEGRRLRAGRPPGRPLRADRVAGVLSRRQAAGRHRRPAGPDGRGPGLGRRQAEARPLGPRHLRHRLRRELVARRHQDRLRLHRQHGAGHRRQDGRAGAVPGRAHRLGARTPSSRPTDRT